MVINLAPVSLSNKKVNLYTCSRPTFLKTKFHRKCLKEHYWDTRFQNYLEGMPQTPLATSAFGVRNLPHLVLKSGYSPDFMMISSIFSSCCLFNSACSFWKARNSACLFLSASIILSERFCCDSARAWKLFAISFKAWGWLLTRFLRSSGFTSNAFLKTFLFAPSVPLSLVEVIAHNATTYPGLFHALRR